jgi:glycerol-3-phosphate acyltransferase PlsX
MGSIYSNYILGKENPTVGLLNIGEEKSKGYAVVQSAYELLEKSTLNFVGNVEGRDILTGKVNVVVCDGFVGNVLLKFTESIYKIISKKLKESISKNLLAILGIIKKDFDYAEYGGAPLIGVNGVVIKAHGSSSAKAIKNALKVAQRFKENKVNEHIKEKLEESKPKTS